MKTQSSNSKLNLGHVQLNHRPKKIAKIITSKCKQPTIIRVDDNFIFFLYRYRYREEERAEVETKGCSNGAEGYDQEATVGPHLQLVTVCPRRLVNFLYNDPNLAQSKVTYF